MECRAHSNKLNASESQASRMMQDLSNYSEHFMHRYKQRLEPKTGNKLDLHVGIIGAGLAGLRCAQVLVEEGIRTTVIEARDRFGGRVHQASLRGRPIDMGPSWIHGTDDNPILKLAEVASCKFASPSEITNLYGSNGVLIESQKTSEGFRIFWGIIAEAFRHSNDDQAVIPSHMSLKDFFRNRLEANGEDNEFQEFVLELAEIWGGFIGDSVRKQSLKWFWLEECLDDNLFISNTHQAIIDHISESVIEHADIYLSTVVQKIETQQRESKRERVMLMTTHGCFAFDEVVVTVPLGCLKSGTLECFPELPPSIKRSIAGASYSGLEKVYLAFPVAFWEGSSGTAPGNVNGIAPSETRLPILTHFLRPDYVPDSQREWRLDMLALSSMTAFGDYAQPVLLFGLWDVSAAQLTSAIANLQPSSSKYYNAINNLFLPFYSRLPHYREHHPDCTPAAVIATNWRNDEFAGNGSYTNFQIPEQRENDPVVDEGIRSIRQGLPERGIWFAGEHTAPLVSLGTSTGAYWSGEAAATRIIESRKKHF